MSRQRIGIACSLALILSAASARGQQVPRPKAPGPTPKQAQAKAGGNAPPIIPLPAMTPEMEKLLAAWEARSRDIKTLQANFERFDDFRATSGEFNQYKGEAVLKAPNLAYLNFQEVHKDGSIDGLTERIVCTGDTVLQYVGETQQILVWPLAKEARNKAMEEGPLPFLFNMNAADVKKRYALRLRPSPAKEPGKPDRSNHYFIEIIPRLDIDRDAFRIAYIFLDKQTFLPSDLKLILPNDQDTQLYRFSTPIVANPRVDPTRFDFVRFKGWKVVDNPGAVNNGGPVPKQVGARPAVKGIGGRR